MREDQTNGRQFRRSADNAMLGGVCAGIAEYFGFCLKATRILAVIGFLINPLLGVAAYLAIVVLVPTAPAAAQHPEVDPRFQRTVRSSPQRAIGDVRRRFQSLDRRLARLEKYVTSGRFKLDREFRDLGHE